MCFCAVRGWKTCSEQIPVATFVEVRAPQKIWRPKHHLPHRATTHRPPAQEDNQDYWERQGARYTDNSFGEVSQRKHDWTAVGDAALPFQWKGATMLQGSPSRNIINTYKRTTMRNNTTNTKKELRQPRTLTTPKLVSNARTRSSNRDNPSHK